MKKILLFLTMITFPALLVAQGAGQQVVREPKPVKVSPKPKKKQNKINKQTKTIQSQNNQSSQPTHSTSPLTPVIQKLIDNMVLVEGGTFIMGATAEQGQDASINEKPTHEVSLSSYYICKYEVTQEEWQAVMGNNPSRFKGAKRPVENVSWNDCQTFIRKLNNVTGKNFCLPTEAEWEYAARGGKNSKGYNYSGSNILDDVAWYKRNSDEHTHNVGQKIPNELGLYDMSGNVEEWCQDWFGEYSSEAQTNPAVLSIGSYRIRRGGSWLNKAKYCRSSRRYYYAPHFRQKDLGIRLVLPQ